MSTMKPKARTEGLLTRMLGDEIIVYVRATHQAHCLSPVAAKVWTLADGSRTVEQIAAEVGQAETEQSIAELGALDLIETPTLHTRRQALGRIAGAAAAVPVVASILAPTPAAAGTCVASGQPALSASSCCSGSLGGITPGLCD